MKIRFLFLSCLAALTAGAQNIHQGYEYVDLGCNVLWATTNIGASTPMQYGSQFAFGETSSRTYFTLDNYKFYDKEKDEYVLPPGDFGGDSKYDAATAHWGGSWRLPSEGDITDMFINCDMQDTIISGVRAWVITSRINNNSIIMPDTYVTEIQDWRGAYFWSYSNFPVTGEGYAMRLSWGYPAAGSYPIWGGLPVRPVLNLDFQPMPGHASISLLNSDNNQLSSNASSAWSYFSGLLDTIPTYGWTCETNLVSPPELPYLQIDLLEPYSGNIELLIQRIMPQRIQQPTRFDIYGSGNPDSDFSRLTSIHLPYRWPGTWEKADITLSKPVRYLRLVCTECNDTIKNPESWCLGELRIYTDTPSAVQPASIGSQGKSSYTISGQVATEGSTGIIIEDGKKKIIMNRSER